MPAPNSCPQPTNLLQMNGSGPQERNGAIIRAEGESEAARLISEATKLSGPAFMDLRKIEVRALALHRAAGALRICSSLHLWGGPERMGCGILALLRFCPTCMCWTRCFARWCEGVGNIRSAGPLMACAGTTLQPRKAVSRQVRAERCLVPSLFYAPFHPHPSAPNCPRRPQGTSQRRCPRAGG